ncbi:MAG: cytochrome c-type biogenesis protein CcmH [Gammaproteobacteria bacterium]|nr:cytochrome c-type biogenesis protein CcmH [Gammaproteobacteria bacterium]
MNAPRLPVILIVWFSLSTAYALDAHKPLDNPEQQELYERLTEEVRCLVCQNQTIGDSSAPLAADLRREVWEMVAAGQSEQQIKTFLTDRYGDFVLYKPRYGGPAALLWLAPGLLLIFGGFVLWRVVRRRTALPVNLDNDSTNGSGD